MKSIFKGISASGFAYLVPFLAFAQTVSESEISGYVQSLVDFINNVIIPLILAIAFLVFIWGIFKFFIMGADDETEREKGKKLMIWGILGFVIIIAIVGIVTLIANATGLTGSDAGTLPTPDIPFNN